MRCGLKNLDSKLYYTWIIEYDEWYVHAERFWYTVQTVLQVVRSKHKKHQVMHMLSNKY